MKLKAVEMQGFKSFPDRTKLTFDDGITVIVGPNGSGKSNISDAIKWVFGEQSVKSLRGAKMEDVIFGGSISRKPTGFAWVSLFIDNTDRSIDIDSDEVVITRRLYRSGEASTASIITRCACGISTRCLWIQALDGMAIRSLSRARSRRS